MTFSTNKAELVGFVERDPAIHYDAQKNATCAHLTIRTFYVSRTKSGQPKLFYQYVNVTLFREKLHLLEDYQIAKNSYVALKGHVANTKRTDSATGETTFGSSWVVQVLLKLELSESDAKKFKEASELPENLASDE